MYLAIQAYPLVKVYWCSSKSIQNDTGGNTRVPPFATFPFRLKDGADRYRCRVSHALKKQRRMDHSIRSIFLSLLKRFLTEHFFGSGIYFIYQYWIDFLRRSREYSDYI